MTLTVFHRSLDKLDQRPLFFFIYCLAGCLKVPYSLQITLPVFGDCTGVSELTHCFSLRLMCAVKTALCDVIRGIWFIASFPGRVATPPAASTLWDHQPACFGLTVVFARSRFFFSQEAVHSLLTFKKIIIIINIYRYVFISLLPSEYAPLLSLVNSGAKKWFQNGTLRRSKYF